MVTARPPDQLVGAALRMAMVAHAGQVDHADMPILAHVLRVTAAVAHLGPDAMIVALLHDVLEDSDVVFTDIQQLFGTAIALEVDALTFKGGDYMEYIRMIAERGGLALRVKRADNIDNADERRLGALPAERAANLRQRYAEAADILFDRLTLTC